MGPQSDDETSDLLDWLGSWDPERFDLLAVNRALKARFRRSRARRNPMLQ